MHSRRANIGRTVLLVAVFCLGNDTFAAAAEDGSRNRLDAQTSPYLRLHKDNPVHWYAWGSEAFDAAKRRNVPVVLSIGYSSCHWCHVMNAESFADPETAKYLNENFVCIKVDREERPDVDHVYMAAVQALTGNGGWPLTAFLLPDGRPFFGGTYFPPEDRTDDDGKLLMPGFRRVLATMKTLWDTKRPDIEKQAASLTEFLRRQTQAPSIVQHPIDHEFIRSSAATIKEAFDPEEGGLSFPPDYAPKFPQPSVGLFLLAVAKAGDESASQRVRFQADKMAAGGIHDQVGGGFHRYSVDRQWLVPHFEKMLYDQAQLLSLYSQLHLIAPSPADGKVVRGIMDFLTREMQLENGLYRAALDADSEHEEGKFYVWTADELKEPLGDDYAWAATELGVTGAPNFEGRYILTRPRIGAAGDEERWERVLGKLRTAREKRVRPAADSKAIVAWNALLVCGLADAAAAFEDPRYREAALQTMRALLLHARRPDGALHRHVIDGKGQGEGFADDHAAMVLALLRSHQLTGEANYLDLAEGLMQQMMTQFWDPVGKGFFFASKEAESLFMPFKETYDGAVPSANGLALLALVRLREVTGKPDYGKTAQQTLQYLSKEMAENPTSTTLSFLAAHEWLKQEPAPSEGLPKPTG